MRNPLLIGVPFLVLVLLAGIEVAKRTEVPAGYEVRWLAARPFLRNHQVRSTELKYPGDWLAAIRILLRDDSLEGQHVSAEISAGDSIAPNEVSPRPKLTTQFSEAQVYFYVLKEDATPVGGWTEGASVIPCYSKTDENHTPPKTRTVCIHTPLPILAVHAAKSATEASWLAIEVPNNLRCTFAEFALADKRVLFQVSPKMVGTRAPG